MVRVQLKVISCAFSITRCRWARPEEHAACSVHHLPAVQVQGSGHCCPAQLRPRPHPVALPLVSQCFMFPVSPPHQENHCSPFLYVFFKKKNYAFVVEDFRGLVTRNPHCCAKLCNKQTHPSMVWTFSCCVTVAVWPKRVFICNASSPRIPDLRAT